MEFLIIVTLAYFLPFIIALFAVVLFFGWSFIWSLTSTHKKESITMDELRKEFESIHEIAESIAKGAYWCFDNNCYDAQIDADITVNDLVFIDGAWFMFQELRK
jgi:hypothetical protein